MPRNDILKLGILLAMLLASCSTGSGISPTPVVAGLAATQPEVTRAAVVYPTPEPFRLMLPTPGAEPISGWRPPLYSVPWALSPYDHFYFVRPIAADQVNWPVASYRYGGIFFANTVHTGVDIPAPDGTPIMAAGPGTVIWTDWGLFRETPGDKTDPYGLAVVIRHDFGYKDQQLYTIYAHMSEIIATEGQRVHTGDLLGLVGATGETTGPHLHFEVRFPNNSFHDTYNPELWIAPPQGWGVLVGRVMDNKGKPLEQLETLVQSESTQEIRTVKTYGGGAANPDPYYNENFVLGDLPAGIYKITLFFDKKNRQTWVEVFPGQVTYITFKGDFGFELTHPAAPTLEFLFTPISPTPTP